MSKSVMAAPAVRQMARLGAILLLSGCYSGESASPPHIPWGCIVDIDGTVTTGNRVFAEAEKTLQWVRGEEVAVFYVTARLATKSAATRRLIAKSKLPAGEIFLKDDLMEDSFHYKVRTIQRIQRTHHLLFGIGDKPRDIRIYTTCGIPAFLIRPRSDAGWIALRPAIEEAISWKTLPLDNYGEP
jgi:hypothetical protein